VHVVLPQNYEEPEVIECGQRDAMLVQGVVEPQVSTLPIE
jgi:hypothetical protein